MPQVDPVSILVDINECPALGAGLKDCVDRAAPHVFDGSQAEADGGLISRLVFDGEIPTTDIDIRRRDGDPDPAAIGSVKGDFGGIVLVDREQGGHVFDRVVGF